LLQRKPLCFMTLVMLWSASSNKQLLEITIWRPKLHSFNLWSYLLLKRMLCEPSDFLMMLMLRIQISSTNYHTLPINQLLLNFMFCVCLSGQFADLPVASFLFHAHNSSLHVC
jgi:hypothetical protein